MDKTRMQDALIRAHEAGDTEAARVIGEEIRTRFPKGRSMPPAPASALKGYSPLLETVKDLPQLAGNAVSSFMQGVGDIPVGAGQLVSETVGLAVPSFRDRYRNYMQQRDAMYEGSRDGQAGEIDPARFTGQIVAMGPSGAVRTGARTLLGRMVDSGKIAGVTSLATPTKADDDFWLAKGMQTAASAGIGFLAPPVVEGLVRGASVAVNRIAESFRGTANRAAGMTPQALETTLRVELQNAGVDWNALGQQYRQSILNEVQNAVSRGGKLDPEAIRRLADFQRVGAEPLAGQVSRNPAEFAREQNLARTAQGGPIAERIGQQNEAFISNVPAGDAYAAGGTAIKSLVTRDAARKAGVTSAYNTARAEAGIEADVPLQPVAQRFGQLVEDFGDDKIPAAVMKRLNEFGIMGGTQTRVFNIREAEKLKTLIGNNIDNPNTPTGKALTLLRGSVDDAVNSLADVPGAQAANAFQVARGTAARRFQTIERTPGLRAALDDVAPDQFIEKYAVRGNVNDVANLMRNMGTEGRHAAREGVVDWIRRQAVSGSGDTASFSQAGFNRALQSIGDRKLELIFAGDRNTLETLRALGRASASALKPPPASGVNYSGSGTTILDAVDRAAMLPGLSALLGRPGDIVRAHQVSSALTPAPVTRAAPVIRPETLPQLTGPLSGLAALLAPPITTGILGLR